MLANVPGIIVIAPYDIWDFKYLLKSSIRNDNPVAFLENEYLYAREFEVDDEFYNPEKLDEIGKAKFMTIGKDVTIVSYSRMVGECVKASE